MNIKKIPLEQLRPSPYNPRKNLKPGDPEYDRIKASIVEFDLVEPLVMNERTGNLVGGHQRLKIMRDIGRLDADVVVVDLDDKREKALNIALNKVHGEWDFGALKELLIGLDDGGFDLTKTGFDELELKGLIDWEGLRNTGELEGDPKEHKLETYLEGEIKQIVLYFSGEEFNKIIPRIEMAMSGLGAKNHTEVFIKLLEGYENSLSEQTTG